MELIALKCPNCGAQIECDSLRELIYCQFCGCKIVIKEEAEKQKVTIDHTASLSTTIELAIAALSNLNYKEARVLIDRALEYDGNCLDAMLMKITIETIDGRDTDRYEELAKKCTNNLNLFTEEDVEKYTMLEHTANVSTKVLLEATIVLPNDFISEKFKRFEVFDETGIVGKGKPGQAFRFYFWNGRVNTIRLVEVERGGLLDKRATYNLPVRPINGAVYKVLVNNGQYAIKKIQ